ncbi:MAG: bifunctional oligoribonuclease/PAP phosphatase NrnA [Candidatus Omnitrophota bacterium]|nr:bifunctional oligoribonuclease/PAP phosphatase NrnA [Candidatus Omnitrophota bacterium]MDZ4242093.1 bifunctional oligoribonuclease/PAP phosphatase NrnA [Candidatus Omnitrophota bacterium]
MKATREILQAIKKHRRFLISTHVSPDPDGLSSELAMAMFLRKMGKQVVIVNEETVPVRYGFLPGAKMIRSCRAARIADYDAAIIVDCGDLGRIGPVGKLLRPDRLLINIDHHITNDLFGDLNLNDPSASSTAEVIYELFREGGASLTKDMAVLLYLGIMTDTGCFRYENTTSRTHEVAGHLLKFSFSISELYRRLYETVPLRDLQNFSRLLNHFEVFEKGRIVCLEVSKQMLRQFSDAIDLRDCVFKYLRTIAGVEVLVVLTEHRKNETRVNLRSQGGVDVARIASGFQGGGHPRASGCKIAGDLKAAKRKIISRIKQSL